MKKAVCRWQKTDSPHAPLDLQGLTFGELTATLDHAPLPDVATMARKAVNRSLILSAQSRARGKRSSAFKIVGSAFARFFKEYVLHGGFRFGFSGMAVAFIAAFEAGAKQIFLGEQLVDLSRLQDGGAGGYAPGSVVVSVDPPAPTRTTP